MRRDAYFMGSSSELRFDGEVEAGVGHEAGDLAGAQGDVDVAEAGLVDGGLEAGGLVVGAGQLEDRAALDRGVEGDPGPPDRVAVLLSGW